MSIPVLRLELSLCNLALLVPRQFLGPAFQ